MSKIQIPTGQKRTKRLFIPITPDEQEKIRQLCKEKNLKIAELIRFSLSQVIEIDL
jgi:hypothetical protein